MKIFIICSKRFYGRIPDFLQSLEKEHDITLPNAYDNPTAEAEQKAKGNEAFRAWKASMLRKSAQIIEENDAVLVLNFEKDGIPNYVGGATFIEMYDAFRLGKKIFLYNPAPEGILHDEINGLSPIVLRGDLSKIS